MKPKNSKKWYSLMLVVLMVFALTCSGFNQPYYVSGNPVMETDENGADFKEPGDLEEYGDSEKQGNSNEKDNLDNSDDFNDKNDSNDTNNPNDSNNKDNPNNPDGSDDSDNKDNPDEPDDPNDSDNKDNPDEPDDPNDSDNKDNPDNPDDPDDSDDKDNPDNPDDPDDSDDKDNPDNPDDSNDSDDKDNPDEPDDPNDSDNKDNPDEPDDSNDSDDSDLLPDLENTDYSVIIQMLRELLYSAETTFDGEHIEWVLSTFENDPEFLISMYLDILGDPGFAQYYLSEIYELYRTHESQIEFYYPPPFNYLISSNATMQNKFDISANQLSNGVSNQVIESSESDDYIEEFKKTVTKYDFRHYNVELSLTAKPELVTQNAADIMLVIDLSLGSSKLDKLKEAAITFAENIYSVTKDNPYPEPNGSRIGFIAYDGSTTIPSNNRKLLMDTYEEFEKAIGGITHGNNSKPNLQAQILDAKYMLGVYDGESVTDRKKAIVFMTANQKVSEHYSDKWTGQGIATSNLPHNTLPGQNFKRWTYMDGGTKYLCGSGLKYNEGSDEANIELIILEGQYAVGQGVDLYAIGIDKGTVLTSALTQMTWKMENYPIIMRGGNANLNYAQGISIDYTIGDSRVRTGSENDIEAIFRDISEQIVREMASGAYVTDTLEKEFEVLLNGKSIPMEDFARGSVYIDRNLAVSLDGEGNQVITWTANNISIYPTSVNYQVRVKDERIWEMGKGLEPDGEPKVPVSSRTSVEYYISGFGYELPLNEQPQVAVDPLIRGSTWITNEYGTPIKAVLSGEIIRLNGCITGGNGEYSYQLYKKDSSGNWEALTEYPTAVYTGQSGINLNIKLDYLDVTNTNEDIYEYVLAITDSVALRAGYYNTDVISFNGDYLQESVIQANYLCSVMIFEPVLKINVVSENEISGQFETIVKNKAGAFWYFMGLDKKTYKFNDGITRGFYQTEVYVPYGYSVIGTPSEVEITLVMENGTWTGYKKEITVYITETDPDFYYGWAWPENKNIIGSSTFMLVPACIYYTGKRKRWYTWLKKR